MEKKPAWMHEAQRPFAAWSSLAQADGDYQKYAQMRFAEPDGEGPSLEFAIRGVGQRAGGVQIRKLSENDERPGELLSSAGLEFMQDKPLAWHGAHVQDGFVLRVGAGADAGEVFLLTHANSSSALHHVLVLEQGARARVMLQSQGEGGEKTEIAHLITHTDVCEVFLAEDARLELATVQDYPQTHAAFSHTYQTLDKFSKSVHLAACFGAGVSRTRALNHLVGGHARAESYQLFAGQGKQAMDLRSHSHHAVPDTGGLMTCRGVLDEAALGVYTGKIKIDRPAANTVSHQAGSAMLLSPHARAYIIPALEVDNDQVEAGHGAAIGGLDDKELLYLRSRGLKEEEAKRLLLAGYFDELADKLSGKEMRARLRARVQKYLERR